MVFGGLLLSSAAPFLLRSIGYWLVVEDEIVASDAIFVHAGHLPFRALEAADLYRDGRALEVWLAPTMPTPEDRALRELGIERRPGHHWRSMVLQRRGVPRAAIRVLPAAVLNTQDEVQAVIDELSARGLKSTILVTSKQHSRRVRLLWDRFAPDGLSATVRPSTSDPFDPQDWWANTDSAQAVLHEIAAIATLWLGIDIRPAQADS